jgi:hypothetical protein
MDHHRSTLFAATSLWLVFASCLLGCGADPHSSVATGVGSATTLASAPKGPTEAPPTAIDELAQLPEKRASDDAFAGRLQAVASSGPSDHQWSIFVTSRYRDVRGRPVRCIVVLQRTPPPPADDPSGQPQVGGTSGGGQCDGLGENQLMLSATGVHAVVVSLRPDGPDRRPIRVQHSHPASRASRLEDLPATYHRISQGDDSYWLAVTEPSAASSDDEVSIAGQQ